MIATATRPQISSEIQRRFKFIDALRGIAVSGVLFWHVGLSSWSSGVTLGLAAPLAPFLARGSMGVQVFFVLSGFVIAYSLSEIPVSFKGLGNFMLRRHLRLDPPYWFSIALVLFVGFIKASVPIFHKEPVSSGWEILVNLFYCQNITHQPIILGPSWTLCIEVQFYLFFIMLLFLARKESNILKSLLIATGLVSLCMPPPVVEHLEPWFVPFWFYFVSGVLCLWVYQSKIKPRLLAAFVVAMVIAAIFRRSEETTCGIITVGLIAAAGARQRLHLWLQDSIFQYLGKISYSLYLTHWVVCTCVFRFAYKVTGSNPGWALIWSLISILLSITLAQWVHLKIESPSMKLASSLKKHSHVPA